MANGHGEPKHHDARVADLPGKEWVSLYSTLILCSSVTKHNVGRHSSESQHEHTTPPIFALKEAVWLLAAGCCRESAKEVAFDVEDAPSTAGFLPVANPFFSAQRYRSSPGKSIRSNSGVNLAVTVAIFGGGRSSRRVMGGEQKKIGRIWVCGAIFFGVC